MVEVSQRYERLVVLRPDGFQERGDGGGRRRLFACLCDCGTRTTVRGDYLSGGITRSCGCLQRAFRHGQNARHGHARMAGWSPTYRSWSSMNKRCTNPREKSFKDYGGRGIRVCARWREFESFLADMGERPEGTTIDRIDVNGNYEPGNCRWATKKQQRANRRDSGKQ